jgi:hypothetical protein
LLALGAWLLLPAGRPGARVQHGGRAVENFRIPSGLSKRIGVWSRLCDR